MFWRNPSAAFFKIQGSAVDGVGFALLVCLGLLPYVGER